MVIFTEKRFDPGLPRHYAEYENSPRLQRIYLNKLPPEMGDRSLELGILQLIGTNQKQAPGKGRALIARTRQELTDATTQQNFIELTETVFIYKFPNLNFQEIGDILGLGDLKQTRAYQEAREEEREELLQITVPLLLEKGMTIEEIAQLYKLPTATVERFAPQK